MVTVHLKQVTKKVGQHTILDNISFEIEKGEFLVVVGPSGCGKSSMLRLIAGLDTITSGQILMDDRCLNNIPAAKRDMAMVFQNYALYPHMTVYDNMAYGLKMRGLPKEDINRRVKAVANLLHLTSYLERKPQELSGGQKQRVAMGRAIVRSPSVYLFDEPLSNLDAKLRTEMRHEIKKLHQKFKTTSVYVTHDQTEAMTMADRVLVLNQGVVEQIGKPQDLYQKPATLFVAGFTGHYPINYVQGIYTKESSRIETETGMEYPLPDSRHELPDRSQVILAIRPEHLQLSNSASATAVEARIDFIDDMGADKLIQATCKRSGETLHLRVSSEQVFTGNSLFLELPVSKLHFFDKNTGKRIGE